MSDKLMDTYKRTGLVFVRGSGATLEAEDGKKYLDLASGIGVNSLGTAIPSSRPPSRSRPPASSTCRTTTRAARP